MKNPIGIGLAIVATAAFASAHGDGPEKNPKDSPLLDNALRDGLQITYKPGGGVTFDGGDEFKLNMRGRVQVRYAYTATDNEGSYGTFALRRARLEFGGHVFSEDVTYLLQSDFVEDGGSSFVKDAWIGWRFLNHEDYTINLRAGLQKMRGSLQSDTSAAYLEFTERALATRTFITDDARAAGALLEGGLWKNDNGDTLMWHFGVYNNDLAFADPATQVAANEGNRMNFTIGAVWDFNGGMTNEKFTEGDLDQTGEMDGRIGVYLASNNDDLSAIGIPNAKNEGYALNVHAAVKSGGGLAAQGEIYLRGDSVESGGTETDLDSMGWYAQASYTTAPGEGTQWGFAGRVGQVMLDDMFPANTLMVRPGQPYFDRALTNFSQGDVTEASLAVNAYYHKHKLKTQIAYTYMDVNPDAGFGTDSTNHGLDVMFTLLF